MHEIASFYTQPTIQYQFFQYLNMLQKVTNVPARFYHLALLNIGLIISISKGHSILHILSSLAFITALAAPIAIYFKFLNPDNIQIVHDEIQAKLTCMYAGVMSYLKNWNQVQEEKRIKYLIHSLLAIYISLNFICPCIETFLLVNAAFIFVFMQEEVEALQKMVCNVCSGKCPIAKTQTS